MPITDAERARWQRQAVWALSELLEVAEASGVAPVTWSVGPRLGLMGRVDFLGTAAAVRAVFSTWCAHLDMTARPEFIDHHMGVTCLSAHGDYQPVRGPSVRVYLSADLTDIDGLDIGEARR